MTSHVSGLSVAGVTDYINTEISTSKQKKFTLVTFVDTPGLVDGDMKYPFDVNKAIRWLGKLNGDPILFFLARIKPPFAYLTPYFSVLHDFLFFAV